MTRRRRTPACERAAQWISLRLDGELSELETAALDRHLAHCARCDALAAGLAGFTLLLREAPLVEPERRPVPVSPRARKRVARGIGVAAAFASAAAAAVAIVLSSEVAHTTTSSAFSFRSAQEQIRFVQAEQLRIEPREPAPVVLAVPARYAARSL
jgi:predicted anti-sigma-YlaC factor YlaD